MKKFILLFFMVAAVVFSGNVQAQNLNFTGEKQVANSQVLDYHPMSVDRAVIWSEDFEGGAMPTGWTEQLGAATQGWTFNADASSQYFPIPAHTIYAAINDDECNCDMSDVWLITPEIDLSTATTPKLGFESYLYMYVGTFTLKASIDGGTTWTDVTTFSTSEAWTSEEVDLSAYAGEMLHLAFHYNDGGEWDYGWAIDDVMVFEPEAHDMAVIGITPSVVLSGETVAPMVAIENVGGSDEAVWSVELSDGAGYTETVADEATVAIGTQYVITFPDWTPADGNYTLTATLTLADDAEPANDVLTQEVIVDEFMLVHGANSNGASGTYYLGMVDWATEYAPGVNMYGGCYITDKLYGITDGGAFGYFDAAVETWTEIGATGISGESFVISMAYDPIGGGIYTLGLSGSYPAFQINLYSIDMSTGAATLVATSPQTGTLLAIGASATGALYGIMHSDSGNGSFVMIDKTDASITVVGDMGMVVSAYFQSMTFDLETNECYFQAFDDAGGMNGSYMINMADGTPTMIGPDALATQLTAFGIPYDFVAVENVLSDGEFSIYPNPANDVLIIANAENGNVTIYNMLGQVVLSEETIELREHVNVSDLPEGNYVLRVSNGISSSTQKLSIVR